MIAVRELGKRLLGNSRRKADPTKPAAWEVTRQRMQRGSRAWWKRLQGVIQTLRNVEQITVALVVSVKGHCVVVEYG